MASADTGRVSGEGVLPALLFPLLLLLLPLLTAPAPLFPSVLALAFRSCNQAEEGRVSDGAGEKVDWEGGRAERRREKKGERYGGL